MQELIDAIGQISAGNRLDAIYLKHSAGRQLGLLAIEEEMLSDGRSVFNLVIAEAAAPAER
jgi:hypothetical protein